MAGHLKHKVVFAIAFVYYTCVPTLANSDRAGVRPRHASQKNVEPWVAAWQRHHQHPDLEMLPDQVQMLACSWQFHSFAEGYSKSNGCRYLAGFEYACASMAGRSSTCSSACAIRIPVGPESGYATLCDRDAMVSTWINGPEVCNDNNVVNGDGCSNSCTVEAGWTCSTGTGSTCSLKIIPVQGDGDIGRTDDVIDCDIGSGHGIGCDGDELGSRQFQFEAVSSSAPASSSKEEVLQFLEEAGDFIYTEEDY
mmetsp:Transcript_73266/g.118898  ORF Transcript_73266/g.118898 Transcript_73266/m.118898 type:complete len:252 (+) Transcript_73266:22-777(+)